MRFLQLIFSCVVVCALSACGDGVQQDCDVESTFEAVQQVFDARGCTASVCHGKPADEAEGKLDLREGSSFDSLIDGAPQASNMARIFPGDEELSLLYLKLAAATNGEALPNGIAGGAMPASGSALSDDELELVRLWIRSGAPEQGFVADTGAVLKCNPIVDTDPNKIPPPDPPAADVGVQLYAGGWSLPAESEDEVCFVTYYDYSQKIPGEKQFACSDKHGGSGRNCFAFKNILLSQDPQSHHAITEMYIPPSSKPEQWDPTSSDWKNWQCLGGANDGMACDPTAAGACGERSTCATEPETAVACTLYPNGPAELLSLAGFGVDIGFATRRPITIAQEFIFREEFAEGVFQEMPVKGFLVWNSHAFNLTRKDTTVEQWLTLEFSEANERKFERRQLFEADFIFRMGPIPAFESKEICATFTMPRYSRIATLSTHMHKRGSLFRVWYPPNEPCDGPGPNCQPRTDREAEHTSRLYNDPLYERFSGESEFVMDAPGDNDRTFLYCAVYDNGETDPSRVKRHSLRPDAGTCAFLEDLEDVAPLIPATVGDVALQCGCAAEERACYGGGSEGMLCGGDDAMCGQGVCDACPLKGGITTEDEMFAILGSWYQGVPEE